jgi:integrase/recombinase XerD
VVNEAIIETLFFTAVRADELCHLQIRDLPISHGKDVVYVRNGKGRVSRTIEIPPYLSQRLACFVKDYRRHAKPRSPLFASERGYRKISWRTQRRAKTHKGMIIENHTEHSSRLTYDSLYSKLRIIGRKAGLKRLTPHMLRHTCLTRLYNIEQDLLFVRDQAGHRYTTTTAIYARTSNQARRRQVEALEV